MAIISAQQCLQISMSKQQEAGQWHFLDVRSQSEFAEGSIAPFCNIPILTDEERHQVGLCYKNQGQDAAFALGYQLTAPFKQRRVQAWQRLANGQTLIVTCWRGGARSRLACEWLRAEGVHALQVDGGYKVLRALLRERLERPPPLLVLSGVTGSGKTLLLRELQQQPSFAAKLSLLDLELHARHRGSAFGECGLQPSQQNFENRIACDLFRVDDRNGLCLVEDESRLIGRVEVPASLKQAMYRAPVIVLTASPEQRLQITHAEYVLEPLRAGVSLEDLFQRLATSLSRLQKKLGDMRYRQMLTALREACFGDVQDWQTHEGWILPLLLEYYDPRYQYSFAQSDRRIVFQGARDDVIQWLTSL